MSSAARVFGDSGLVIFDETGTPVWINGRALEILVYPNTPRAVPPTLLETRCSRLFDHTVAGAPRVEHIVPYLVSGRRRYQCRRTPLEAVPRSGGNGVFAVLIERSHSWTAMTSALANRFRLSPREHQSLTLLGEGLTSKEMAERMQISPNTVKAFLHVIMIKLGVSNRSSIISKVLGADQRAPETTNTSDPERP